MFSAAIKGQQEKEPGAPEEFKKEMTAIQNYAEEKKNLIMQYIGKHVATYGKRFTPAPEFQFTAEVGITWYRSDVSNSF